MSASEKALSVISVDTAIAQFNDFEKVIAELEIEFKDRVYDMNSPKENSLARADRLFLSKKAKAVDELRKTLKKEAEKTAIEIHKHGQSVCGRVEVLRDAIKAQVDKWDDEQKRIKEEKEQAAAELEAKMETLRNIPLITGHETAAELEILISNAEAICFDETYDKRIKEATQLLHDGIASLKMFYENTLEDEENKAKLKKLEEEKEDREKKEKQKKHDDEVAETARQEERKKITQESSIGDVTNAVLGEDHPLSQAMNMPEGETTVLCEADAEQSLSDMRGIAKEPAESEDPAPRPEAGLNQTLDIENKKTKNNEALIDLTTHAFVSEETAKLIVKAIASNKIRNVTINY